MTEMQKFVKKIADMTPGCAPSAGYMEKIIQKARRILLLDKGNESGDVARWIPIKERLPESDKLVQIRFTIDYGINIENSIAYDHDRLLDDDGNKMFAIEQHVGLTVTHWREIGEVEQ